MSFAVDGVAPTHPALAALFEHALHAGEHACAWRLSDGREVLQLRDELLVALPSGEVLREKTREGETTREAVARVCGVAR